MDTYKEKYNEALGRAMKFLNKELFAENSECAIKHIFPELAESEDERIREYLIRYIDNTMKSSELKNKLLAWLEKQGNEPNWCHHQIGVTKVDLSGCSEEYRKAYYDGWNSCNQQHSQCKSEWNDVVKCLINGMKFYYEDNEEATWGTEKFSMKVKDILSWLEKQGGQNPQRMISAEAKEAMYGKPAYAWSEEDEVMIKVFDSIIRYIVEVVDKDALERFGTNREELFSWLKSLRPQPKQEWSEEDEEYINDLIGVFDRQQYQAHSDEEIVKWLKSIRLPYNKEWDENDEEMLRSIIATCELAEQDRDSSPARRLLEMQLNWLKSLKQRIGDKL